MMSGWCSLGPCSSKVTTSGELESARLAPCLQTVPVPSDLVHLILFCGPHTIIYTIMTGSRSSPHATLLLLAYANLRYLSAASLFSLSLFSLIC